MENLMMWWVGMASPELPLTRLVGCWLATEDWENVLAPQLPVNSTSVGWASDAVVRGLDATLGVARPGGARGGGLGGVMGFKLDGWAWAGLLVELMLVPWMMW